MRGKEISQTFNKHTTLWRMCSFVLAIVCLALVIYIAVMHYMRISNKVDIEPNVCYGLPDSGKSIFVEPDVPSVFHDLTSREINSLLAFMANNNVLNITSATSSRQSMSSPVVFDITLYLPNKSEVLNYLDKKASKPDRSAQVTVYRYDKSTPVIQEFVIKHINDPHPLKQIEKPVSVYFGPLLDAEIKSITAYLNRKCDKEIRTLLLESFGGTILDCDNKCLVFKPMTVMGPSSWQGKSRMFWFWLTQSVEVSVLHPVDFAILVDAKNSVPTIEKVRYHSLDYDSINILKKKYATDTFVKLRVEFPSDDDITFSEINFRGDPVPKLPQRAPLQIEPDGKRYTILYQMVTYMNWNFHFRMSSVHGPQLHNILFHGNRIVYELGLQEVLLQYSGKSPTHMFGTHFGSLRMIGWQAKHLVPGIDCPASATFLNVTMFVNLKVMRKSHVFCVFEHNTNFPLRRSAFSSSKSFYEGAQTNILILRGITSIFPTDYIIDFIFYPHGALETRVLVAGVILPTHFTGSNSDGDYGFKIHNKIRGNIRRHFCNFKVDVDIGGTKNSFQILEIKNEKVDNSYSIIPSQKKWSQDKLYKSRVHKEGEVLYLHHSTSQQFQLFYTEYDKTKEGNTKSYRLVNKGVLRRNLTNTIADLVTWTRHPLIVTRQKASERHSSSKFSAFTSYGTTKSFDGFYEDNESIKHQDLVAWVTIGTNQVPTSEDLPTVNTPDSEFSFLLTPFNYFFENPTMSCRDAVRYQQEEQMVQVTKKNKPSHVNCFPETSNYEEMLKKDPSILFGD